MSVEIVYETHSTTTDNEDGVATGWRPGRLSGSGRRQAESLGRRHLGLAAVFSSDLARAVETARLAFPGVSLREDRRLRECDYGSLTGMPVARLHAERLSHVDLSWPDGESYRDVVDRTRSFLRDLRGWDGSRVLLIAHSANRWALEHLLLDRDLAELVAEPSAWQPGWTYTLP